MRRSEYKRREMLRIGATGAVGMMAAGHLAPLMSVAQAQAPSIAGALRPGKLGGARIVLDRAQYPAAFQDAPVLARDVAAGKLPPVAQRIGQDPLVLAPLAEIGTYGGTLRRGFIGPIDFQNATRFVAGPDSLLFWDIEWKNVVPNVARGYELSPDGREMLLLLRRGMRWSDGTPFTADDVMFWYEDMYKNPGVVAAPSASLRPGGKETMLTKVDDYTVRFTSQVAHTVLPEIMAGWSELAGPSIQGRAGMGLYAPKHYLSKIHPKYTSEEQVTREAKAAGFESWGAYFKRRNDWVFNPDLPVSSPWRCARPINQSTWVFERNPYSIWVDTRGNQLPYIDTITHALCENSEIVNLRAIAGEFDFQDRHLDPAKLPVLIQNQQRGGYKVYLDPSEINDVGLRLNLSYTADAEIGDLLRNVAFRRAISLGINREEINESFLLGTGTPSAAVPPAQNRYFPGAEWQKRWATYDPNQANQLLDGIGLTNKDREGFRLRRDGRGRLRLTMPTFASQLDYPGIAEMIKDQWRRIGVDVDVQIVDNNLTIQRVLNNEVQLMPFTVSSDDLFVYADLVIPYLTSGFMALIGIEYARWFQSDGQRGTEPFPAVKRAMDLWRQGYTSPVEERIRIGKEIHKIHAEEVFSVGIVSGAVGPYGVHIAKTNIANVPERVLNSQVLKSPANGHPMTFFYKT
jgi:peptide/nickel transport system substrate-binding protein